MVDDTRPSPWLWSLELPCSQGDRVDQLLPEPATEFSPALSDTSSNIKKTNKQKHYDYYCVCKLFKQQEKDHPEPSEFFFQIYTAALNARILLQTLNETHCVSLVFFWDSMLVTPLLNR